jgi:hypothetical protein
MKKVIIMLVMLFTMSVYSFAEENNATKVSEATKYELKVNHRRLAYALNASNDQAEILGDVMTMFEQNMLFASTMENEESKGIIVGNSIKENLKWMRSILNDKQYKTYLRLLNLTLINRGIGYQMSK